MGDKYAGVIIGINHARKSMEQAERMVEAARAALDCQYSLLSSLIAPEGETTYDPVVFSNSIRRGERAGELEKLAKMSGLDAGREVLFANIISYPVRDRVAFGCSVGTQDDAHSVEYGGPESSRPLLQRREENSTEFNFLYGVVADGMVSFLLDRDLLKSGIVIPTNNHVRLRYVSQFPCLDSLNLKDNASVVSGDMIIPAHEIPATLPRDKNKSGFYFGKDVAGFLRE
jgi:hypothetical protein